MPNIINNLLSTETTANTNAVSSTSEQTVKDKPSLFDSLLSNNTAIKEEKATTAVTTPAKEVKTEEKPSVENLEVNSEINPEIKLDNTQLGNIKIEPEKGETDKPEEQKITSTTSLLDRLVIEAKKNVKETIIPKEIKHNSDISIITKESNTENSLEIEVESTNTKDASIIPKENIVATNNIEKRSYYCDQNL